jgi:hypothetical protein
MHAWVRRPSLRGFTCSCVCVTAHPGKPQPWSCLHLVSLYVMQHEYSVIPVQGTPRARQPALRPFVAGQLEALAGDPAFGVVMSRAAGRAPRSPQRARPVSRGGGALPCGAGVLGLSAALKCMQVSARAGLGP